MKVLSRDRDILRQEINTAITQYLGGKSDKGCIVWPKSDQEALLDDLFASITVNLHPAVPNPNISKLPGVLADFCSMGPAEGDIALRSTRIAWKSQKGERVNLFINLAAVSPSMRKMRSRFNIEAERNKEAVANITLDGLGSIASLLTKCAQPTMFERLLPMSVALFAKKSHLTGSPPTIDADAFVTWFEKYCRIEPTGLLELDELELVYESDHTAYLNLGNAMTLTPENAEKLAEIIHAAENAFSIRSDLPNATSLSDLARVMATKSKKTKLDDNDFNAMLKLLEKHKYSSGSNHGYNLNAALADIQ